MAFAFLLLFILVPLAEIAVFIKVGEAITLWPTIAMVVITAIVGTALLRRQGLSAINRANSAVSAGRFPMESVVDAVGLLIAGALLLTPGFITDAVGFALLVPPVRHGLARYLFNRIKNSKNVHINMTGFGFPPGGPDGASPHDPNLGKNPQNSSGPIIDGEIIPPDDKGRNPQKNKRGANKRSPWSD